MTVAAGQNPEHELWADATGSAVSGNYFVAAKVGDDDFGPPAIESGWRRRT